MGWAWLQSPFTSVHSHAIRLGPAGRGAVAGRPAYDAAPGNQGIFPPSALVDRDAYYHLKLAAALHLDREKRQRAAENLSRTPWQALAAFRGRRAAVVMAVGFLAFHEHRVAP